MLKGWNVEMLFKIGNNNNIELLAFEINITTLQHSNLTTTT